MAALDGHGTAEVRSLAYHQRVAEKLLADPSVLVRARAKVRALLDGERCESAARYASGWFRLLEGPVDELAAFITSDSQMPRDFRQASPFAGALEPGERWRLWREAARNTSSIEGETAPPPHVPGTTRWNTRVSTHSAAAIEAQATAPAAAISNASSSEMPAIRRTTAWGTARFGPWRRKRSA